MMSERKPLRIFTWHIHGSYLYYLTQIPCEFFLPVKGDKSEGYGGRSGPFKWGSNVHDVQIKDIKDLEFDCILFQSRKNYETDQHEILTEYQRSLPKLYLEHDPPREVPTDTFHVVKDPSTTIVHVTHFNALMWNNNDVPVKVIQHGVIIPPDVHYTGEKERGIVVINGIVKRGRRLGKDIFEKVAREVPLDIVGMGSKEINGLGEIPNDQLPEFISRYRFFFNPIRYTSLGLSVCEAMMIGLPIIGLATTEMPVTVQNGVSGYIHTDIEFLIEKMKLLLNDKHHAKELGNGARTVASEKFNIERFSNDWLKVFDTVCNEREYVTINKGGLL